MAKKNSTPEGVKVVARNRKVRHHYEILETFEAGLVLMGSEIKSIRAGKVNIGEGFVRADSDGLWLANVHIASYDEASIFGHEPLRLRKLLLHKKEIARMLNRTHEKGYTIVPLQLYLKRGLAKIELATARGKKLYDKRDAKRRQDADRQIERALNSRY